jgi:hypothetical protein
MVGPLGADFALLECALHVGVPPGRKPVHPLRSATLAFRRTRIVLPPAFLCVRASLLIYRVDAGDPTMKLLTSKNDRSSRTRFGSQLRAKATAVPLVLLAVMLTVACGGGTSPTPVTPTTPTTPTPPGGSAFSTNWLVTHRFESVTGPDNCWVRRQRDSLTGIVFTNLDMTVERPGGSIAIKSQWFEEYVGTVNGSDFTAQQAKPLQGTAAPVVCPDGTTVSQLPGVSNLSGRFSGDDQLLTASEVNSYRLATGEPVIYTWEWRATRR